jgi:hypothetical protein
MSNLSMAFLALAYAIATMVCASIVCAALDGIARAIRDLKDKGDEK